jgi:hypothetical protein
MVLELQHFLQHNHCAYKYTQVNLVIKNLHFVKYLKISQEKDKIENNVHCFNNCVQFLWAKTCINIGHFCKSTWANLNETYLKPLLAFFSIITY